MRLQRSGLVLQGVELNNAFWSWSSTQKVPGVGTLCDPGFSKMLHKLHRNWSRLNHGPCHVQTTHHWFWLCGFPGLVNRTRASSPLFLYSTKDLHHLFRVEIYIPSPILIVALTRGIPFQVPTLHYQPAAENPHPYPRSCLGFGSVKHGPESPGTWSLGQFCRGGGRSFKLNEKNKINWVWIGRNGDAREDIILGKYF